MTLTEAIASVGIGRPGSAQGIFRTRKKNYSTGKIETRYSTDAPFRGAYKTVGWVVRGVDGYPATVMISTLCATSPERVEMEAYNFGGVR